MCAREDRHIIYYVATHIIIDDRHSKDVGTTFKVHFRLFLPLKVVHIHSINHIYHIYSTYT